MIDQNEPEGVDGSLRNTPETRQKVKETIDEYMRQTGRTIPPMDLNGKITVTVTITFDYVPPSDLDQTAIDRILK